MLYIFVNSEFCIMKKLWDLAHERWVNIVGGIGVGINIHGCQPYPGNGHLCTEISKQQTILHTTVGMNMSVSEPLVNYKLQFDEIQKINPSEKKSHNIWTISNKTGHCALSFVCCWVRLVSVPARLSSSPSSYLE